MKRSSGSPKNPNRHLALLIAGILVIVAVSSVVVTLHFTSRSRQSNSAAAIEPSNKPETKPLGLTSLDAEKAVGEVLSDWIDGKPSGSISGRRPHIREFKESLDTRRLTNYRIVKTLVSDSEGILKVDDKFLQEAEFAMFSVYVELNFERSSVNQKTIRRFVALHEDRGWMIFGDDDNGKLKER